MRLNVKTTGIIVAIVVGVAVLGSGGYMYVGPFLGKARKASRQVRAKTKELKELQVMFAGYDSPQQKIAAMMQEIEELQALMAPYNKIRGKPLLDKDLPDFLNNPVPEIELELYRDYIEREVERRYETIQDKFDQRDIDLPGNIFPDTFINKISAAVPLLNEISGLEALLDIVLKSDVIAVDSVESSSPKKFKGSFVEVIPLDIVMTVDAESMTNFMYNLAEADRFFYVEELRMEPAEEYDDTFPGYQDRERDLRLVATLYVSQVTKVEASAGVVQKATIEIKKVDQMFGGMKIDLK